MDHLGSKGEGGRTGKGGTEPMAKDERGEPTKGKGDEGPNERTPRDAVLSLCVVEV